MNAAALAMARMPAPEPSRDVVLRLTKDEAATVAAALLATSVQMFNAADRQESAGRIDAATDLMRDGYTLTRIEMRLRNAPQ